jgi:ribosomal protein S6
MNIQKANKNAYFMVKFGTTYQEVANLEEEISCQINFIASGAPTP